MTIPKTFQLHGITITVNLNPHLIRNDDNTGEAIYRADEIVLQSPSVKWQTRERREQVFCHELVHFILHEMNHKLRSDEPFVNLFASLLHQALSSQKGAIK